MSEPLNDTVHGIDPMKEESREFRSYVWGLGIALLLTLVPFALLHWAGLPRYRC